MEAKLPYFVHNSQAPVSLQSQMNAWSQFQSSPHLRSKSVPLKLDNQNAVTLLVSPIRTTRPAQLIICSPQSFIPLETMQYYNFVFYNIYIL